MVVTDYSLSYDQADTIKIKPIFDTHIGSRHFDSRAFKRFLSDADDRTYFLLGGDILDSIIVGDKRYLKSEDITVGDAIVDEQIDHAISLLEPYRGRIIAGVSGNHEEKIISRCATNPVARICGALEAEYLGYSGIVRLRFSHRSGGKTRTVLIRLHHGWGGGTTEGADINRYSKESLAYDSDIFLYGHSHGLKLDVTQRIVTTRKGLEQRPRLVCVCGTFRDSLSTTSDITYSEKKGYTPKPVGGLTLSLRPNEKWFDVSGEVKLC